MIGLVPSNLNVIFRMIFVLELKGGIANKDIAVRSKSME